MNGAGIQSRELDERVYNRLAGLRQQEYDLRRQTLEEMIAERLVAAEAAKRGISAEALVKQEVDKKATPPDEAQLDTIYEQNKPRFGNAPKKEAIARIREILTQRAVAERRAVFEKDLRRAASVSVRLEPPRIDVKIPAEAPATGPNDAPVTIVEFTDYQCPYCHRAQARVDEVLKPLRGQGAVRPPRLPARHPRPRPCPAARAARCAGEQGKFWEYHRSLLTQSGGMDDGRPQGRAPRRWASTGAPLRHLPGVRPPRRGDPGGAAARAPSSGVTGTPTFFVNGRLLSGAQPVEDFADVIDAELRRAASATPVSLDLQPASL